MRKFQPDYRNIVDVAYNREAARLPLYEYLVDTGKIGEIIGKDFAGLIEGTDRDLDEFFSLYCGFFRDYGYDIVPFECCISGIMPGSGALEGQQGRPCHPDQRGGGEVSLGGNPGVIL